MLPAGINLSMRFRLSTSLVASSKFLAFLLLSLVRLSLVASVAIAKFSSSFGS